jgi:hypothetical protein
MLRCCFDYTSWLTAPPSLSCATAFPTVRQARQLLLLLLLLLALALHYCCCAASWVLLGGC